MNVPFYQRCMKSNRAPQVSEDKKKTGGGEGFHIFPQLYKMTLNGKIRLMCLGLIIVIGTLTYKTVKCESTIPRVIFKLRQMDRVKDSTGPREPTE